MNSARRAISAISSRVISGLLAGSGGLELLSDHPFPQIDDVAVLHPVHQGLDVRDHLSGDVGAVALLPGRTELGTCFQPEADGPPVRPGHVGDADLPAGGLLLEGVLRQQDRGLLGVPHEGDHGHVLEGEEHLHRANGLVVEAGHLSDVVGGAGGVLVVELPDRDLLRQHPEGLDLPGLLDLHGQLGLLLRHQGEVVDQAGPPLLQPPRFQKGLGLLLGLPDGHDPRWSGDEGDDRVLRSQPRQAPSRPMILPTRLWAGDSCRR